MGHGCYSDGVFNTANSHFDRQSNPKPHQSPTGCLVHSLLYAVFGGIKAFLSSTPLSCSVGSWLGLSSGTRHLERVSRDLSRETVVGLLMAMAAPSSLSQCYSIGSFSKSKLLVQRPAPPVASRMFLFHLAFYV